MHTIKPTLIYAVDDSQHDTSCCVKWILGKRWKHSQTVVSFPAKCYHGLTLGCLPVPLICCNKGHRDKYMYLQTESIFITICW